MSNANKLSELEGFYKSEQFTEKYRLKSELKVIEVQSHKLEEF